MKVKMGDIFLALGLCLVVPLVAMASAIAVYKRLKVQQAEAAEKLGDASYMEDLYPEA